MTLAWLWTIGAVIGVVMNSSYSANEELLPELAELSRLAYEAHKLMSDSAWSATETGRDDDEEWRTAAEDLARQLKDLWIRLSDGASG